MRYYNNNEVEYLFYFHFYASGTCGIPLYSSNVLLLKASLMNLFRCYSADMGEQRQWKSYSGGVDSPSEGAHPCWGRGNATEILF